MANQPRSIKSLTGSVLDELNVEPLQERLELSAMVTLEALMAGVDTLEPDDGSGSGSCPTNNDCATRIPGDEDGDTCVVVNQCVSRGKCGVFGQCGEQGPG